MFVYKSLKTYILMRQLFHESQMAELLHLESNACWLKSLASAQLVLGT